MSALSISDVCFEPVSTAHLKEAQTNTKRGLIHESTSKTEEEKKVEKSTHLRVQADRYSHTFRFCLLQRILTLMSNSLSGLADGKIGRWCLLVPAWPSPTCSRRRVPPHPMTLMSWLGF